MEREGYRRNDGDRCYHCKAELLDVLTPLAEQHGLEHVVTGTNADDVVAGFRPGIRAAAERAARTPLADAGITKAQVRAASRAWGLPTWDKPAAACLSSRIAYGLEVTPAGLARVERAEEAVRRTLAGLGLDSGNLRVRDLGDEAVGRARPRGRRRPGRPGGRCAPGGGRGSRFPHRHGRPAGVPLRLDERAAAGARAVPLNPLAAAAAAPVGLPGQHGAAH